MSSEIQKYFYLKFILYYLYNDEGYKKTLDGKYDFYIFDDAFLNVLSNLISFFSQNNIFETKEKDKAYMLLSYLRDKSKFDNLEVKKCYYDFINDLIIQLNCQQKNGNDAFYIIEMLKRKFCKKKMTIKEFQEKKKIVKKSLGYDFIFLIYHCDNIKEESFDNSIKSLLDNSEYYFASLNSIIDECPELLKDETFSRRVEKVLNLKKEQISSTQIKFYEKYIFEKK